MQGWERSISSHIWETRGSLGMVSGDLLRVSLPLVVPLPAAAAQPQARLGLAL